MAAARGPNGRFTAVRDANFEPKRVRKARRKARVRELERVRGYIPNRVADARAEAADRAEFYRNLRMMKQHRRLIARTMARLSSEADRLHQEVVRACELVERYGPDREDTRLMVEACDVARQAAASARVAADEWYAFARRRMYYVRDLELAA